jgi:hypothetical protein
MIFFTVYMRYEYSHLSVQKPGTVNLFMSFLPKCFLFYYVQIMGMHLDIYTVNANW